MRRPSRQGLSCLFVFIAILASTAQHLESIGRGKPLKFSGGLAFNQVLYAGNGGTHRDPYSCFISGQLNISVYGWNIPLRFNVTNRKAAFVQPFNHYSVHPSWKWIAVHAGFTSMTFSPYTVNGHIFLGVGVDLDPGENFSISALYGRFAKPVEPGGKPAAASSAAYERSGYGLKVGWGNEGNFLNLILFHAEDEEHSIAPLHDSLQITPQENLVASIGVGKTIGKIQIKSEFSASAITRDTRTPTNRTRHALARLFLFHPKASSSYYHAIRTSVTYQREGWMLGLSHERIDPGYRTFGGYYFNSDMESVSVNGVSKLIPGKLQVSLSGGVQNDNVDKTKISTLRRVLSALHIQFTPSTKFNLAGSFSTFRSFSNIRSPLPTSSSSPAYENMDTLNFAQLSKNASLTTAFSWQASKTRKENITFNFSWQEADEYRGLNTGESISFYNLNAGYSISFVPRNMAISLFCNTTAHSGPSVRTLVAGPTATVTRTYLNRKVRIMLAASWNRMFNNRATTNTMFNARLTSAVSISKLHQFQLSAVLLNRMDRGKEAKSTAEFLATVGYHYAFRDRP